MDPNQQNQYDFILNAGAQKKSALPLPALTPDTSTKKGRIILVLGAGLILIIGLIVLFSFLGKAGKPDIVNLTSLAAQQNEIMRIASLTQNKSQSIAISNAAASVSSVILSDQQALMKYLANNNKKVTEKDLSSAKSTKTDSALETASRNNRFDEEYTAIMNTKLVDYQKKVKDRYSNAKNATEKKILKESFDHITLILVVPTTSPTLKP